MILVYVYIISVIISCIHAIVYHDDYKNDLIERGFFSFWFYIIQALFIVLPILNTWKAFTAIQHFREDYDDKSR